jgi:hypothetical protein
MAWWSHGVLETCVACEEHHDEVARGGEGRNMDMHADW